MDSQLFKIVSEQISTCCVKCRKPQKFDFDTKISRCPFCMDFFKPKAQLIFLLEEELQSLIVSESKTSLLKYSRFKQTLLVILITGSLFSTGWIQSLFLISLIFGFTVYRSKLNYPKNSKITDLKISIEKLEKLYQSDL